MKLTPPITNRVTAIIQSYPAVHEIVKALAQEGGKVLLVGGAVRDLLLDLPVKDIDLEVHGISLQALEHILRNFGPVSLVGKAYGVLRLHGLDADWSLPRTDTSGRHPHVTIDPFMSMRDAFARRDLTINAMGIDLTTFELVDPFNGQQDLKNGILRAPDVQFFIEDPLRFYRVMQFVGRFNMQPDAQLTDVCKRMDIAAVSRERIEKEFEKLFLRSQRPSLGIRWLHAIGRLQEIVPELAATIGIEQEMQWHPEGDVFEHSMQALDAAARLQYDNPFTKLIMMYAALFHDLGKVVTTKIIDGRIRSLGHDVAGVLLAKRALQRISNTKELSVAVQKLVRYHMQPLVFLKGGAKDAAYKRLAHKLAPQLTLDLLADLALADWQGRNPRGHEPLTTTFPDLVTFKEKAAQLQVLHKPEEPILKGRDLLDCIAPGKKMGQLLAKAYEIQIQEGITDKQELKRRVR